MSRRYLPDTTYSQRELGARRVEQSAGYGAGAVGLGFGAAKLRDAYAEEHPASFDRALARAGAAGLRHHVSPGTVLRTQRIARYGKPGFKPLAAAAVLGTVATSAKRFRVHNDIQQQKARLGKAAEPVYELGKIPRYAHVKGIGRVHIEHYAGNGHFMVRDRSDALRKVHRDKLQFVKKSLEEAMPTVTSAFGVEHEVSKAAPARYTDAKARAQAARKGQALPDGSFPEQTRAQVLRGARMVGHAADPARAAAFTRRRAKQLHVSLKGTALDDGVSKASAFGAKGDKRNTKYVGAAYGGSLAGGAIGRQVATRTAGTTPGEVNRLARSYGGMRGEKLAEKVQRLTEETRGASGARQFAEGAKLGFREGRSIVGGLKHSVPGAARMIHGGYIGAASGAAGGAALYAAHRHRMHKSAFGVEHEMIAKDEQPKASSGRYGAAYLGGPIHGLVAGRKGKKLRAAGREAATQAGGYLGALGGSTAGSHRAVTVNQRRGYYKPERS